MAKFPRIDSPCPLTLDQLPASGNFHCQYCHKHVHDISAMDDDQRQSFLLECTGDICVSYRLKQRVLNTAKVGALITGVITAATVLPVTAEQNAVEEEFFELVIVGGVKDAKNAPLVDGDEIIHEQPKLEKIPVIIIDQNDDS